MNEQRLKNIYIDIGNIFITEMLTYLDILLKMMNEYGYTKIERDPKDYLFLSLGSKMLIIYVAQKRVTGEEVLKHARILEQLDGEKYIICMKDYTPDAYETAKKYNIIINNRKDLANDIGEFILKKIEDKEEYNLEELFVDENFEIEEIERETPEIKADTDAIPIFLEEVPKLNEQIIKPIISKEDALINAQRKIHGFNISLVLVPYLIFEFTLDIYVENELTPKSKKGIICINLNTQPEHKEFIFLDKGLETLSSISESHERLKIELEATEAEIKARKIILLEYSKPKEDTIPKENVIIIEKKRQRPKEDSMKLNELGIYYWPYWVVSGARGTLKMNAVDGSEIESTEQE
jgi:hypothetical protein